MAIDQLALIYGIIGTYKPKARQGCTIVMHNLRYYRSTMPTRLLLNMFNGTDPHVGSRSLHLSRAALVDPESRRGSEIRAPLFGLDLQVRGTKRFWPIYGHPQEAQERLYR
jgi:hypothetical protein